MTGLGFGIKKRILAAVRQMKLYIDFSMGSLIQLFRRLPPNDKNVLFILEARKLFREDDDSGRYPFLILSAFSNAGYNVTMLKKMDLKKFIGLCRYGREIYGLKNMKFIDELPPDPGNTVLVFDQEALPADILNAGWKKIVYLNAYKPHNWIIGESWVWIPFFMHMYQYKHGGHLKLKSYRSNAKKMKALFAGNTHEDYYSNPKLGSLYDQLTRSDGLKALLELEEDTERIYNLKHLKQLNDTHGLPRNKCMVFETNCFTIDPDEWLSVLSHSDFFVCLSGTDMPMCHNAVEAMAVGVIPIISYQDWFFPALEHGKNAIVYTDAEDLKSKIKDVLAMDEADIARLRDNAIDYYEDHLATGSFIQAFEADHHNVMTLVLHPRYVGGERDEMDYSESEFDQLSKRTNSPRIVLHSEHPIVIPN